MLRYFKDPQLTFWAVTVAVLVAVAVVAAHFGNTQPHPASPGTVIVASAPVSAARTQVLALQSLLPSGIAAGTDPAALTAFAGAVASQARAGAAVRAAEGAPKDDPLLSGLRNVSGLAAQLSGVASDPVAATSVRTQLGMNVTQLASLIAGLPAPQLPAGAADPLPTNPDLQLPVPPPAPAPTVTAVPKPGH